MNYFLVILDLGVLKDYKFYEKVFFFKIFGWKYDDEINGFYWWNFSEVIKLNEMFY